MNKKITLSSLTIEEARELAHSDEERAEFKYVDEVLIKEEKERKEFVEHAHKIFFLIRGRPGT